MMKNLLALLFTSLLVFSISAPLCAQDSAKAEKQARWEGNVVRINSDKSTLDVHQTNGTVEKAIHYDSSTKWTSQAHNSKTADSIDVSQVKEGDRVICVGKLDEKGTFQATLISKRLTK